MIFILIFNLTVLVFLGFHGMADLVSIGVDPNLWFSNFSQFPWDLPATDQTSTLPPPPQHLLSSSTSGQPGQRYSCDLCKKSYAQYTYLYNHKKFECGKPASLKCPYCRHMTKLKGNLKAHIMNRHSKAVMAQAEKAQAEKTLREKSEQHLNATLSLEGTLDTTSLTNSLEASISSLQSQNDNNSIQMRSNHFSPERLIGSKGVDLDESALDFP